MLKSGRPSCRRSGWGSEIGPRLRSRGSGCRRRPGCAGTSSRRPSKGRHEPPAGSRPAPPGGARTTTATRQRRRHRQGRDLVPAARPTASPAAASGQPTRHRVVPLCSCMTAPTDLAMAAQASTRIAIAASSRAAAARSFLAAPGSRTTRVWHSSRIAAATTVRCPAPVGPADATGGEEGDRQPAEVEEERQRVALGEQDPDPVEELGVLRVEPVREDRLGVVHPVTEWLWAMSTANGMWYQRRVEVEHASVQGVLRRHG